MYKNIHQACNFIAPWDSKIIVDLGSRWGENYENFGINRPDAVFYFVEPSIRCIPKIKEVIQRYPDRDLRLIEGVLGVEDRDIDFYMLESDNDQSGNLFSNRRGIYGNHQLIKVKQHNFTNLFPDKIDFVKCNIEGGEYDLIDQGFFKNVGSFVMEVHNQHVQGKNFKDAIKGLEERFDINVWGDVNYKYCFINGIMKNA